MENSNGTKAIRAASPVDARAVGAPAKHAPTEPMVVCAGDPRYISVPGIVKPIKCGSQSVARRIARSVNAHDDMLDALRDAEEYLADEPSPDVGGSAYVPELRRKIAAAIARAEGRS